MKQVKLKIDGMSCAACSSSIERSLGRKDFIEQIEVDLINTNAFVKYDESKTNIQDIIKLIEKLGYSAEIESNKVEKKIKNNDYLIAIIFAIPLFVISMGSMFVEVKNTLLVCFIEIVLLLPILYSGRRIFTKGFMSLVRLVPNMDSLVMLGSLSAVIYSFYMLVLEFDSPHLLHNLYFESAGVIIAVIMFGKKLESIATSSAKSGLDELINLSPKTVLKLIDNKIIEAKINDIKVGDIVVLPKGEMLSVDSILLDDGALFDESIITGESKLKARKKGDLIYSGSINQSEQITLNVVAKSADSMIGKIINLMQGVKKAPIARIADIISAYFVPSVIFIALISAIVWYFIKEDFHTSFVIFTSTLLISCPCALGLATPLSILMATSIASKRAFYFKSGKSLEVASKITTIIFDKTGTLTKGNLTILESNFYSKNLDKKYILNLVYFLESKSEHIIAKAIIKYISKEIEIKNVEIKNVETISGKGISATIDNKFVKIGNFAFINESSKIKIPAIESKHNVCYVSIDNELCASFVIADELRENAKTLITNLKKLGIKSMILSGDAESSVSSVAALCGIEEYYHSQLPNDKLEFINNLVDPKDSKGVTDSSHSNKPHKKEYIAFVGDGINDALALSKADIAISFSNANDIAIKQSDIVLLNNDFNSLFEAFLLSKKTIRNIKENLAFAFIYNICAIPIAVGIPHIFGINLTLNPMIAGVAMGLSSISVVLNAMRLKYIRF